MTPLIESYKKILSTVDCIVTEDDTIVYKRDSKSEPEEIKFKVNNIEKKLVLPTAKLLKDGHWDKIVAFHPTSESLFNGQSEVLNVFIGLIANKLYITTQRLVAGIITLALNKKAHGKLSLAQRELLDMFTVDDNVEKFAIDVTNKQTGVGGKFPILSIRLERGGEIEGEKYSRICKLITHVINKENVCGVVGSNAKAKQTLKDIYGYVLPKNLIVGSNSVDCPYLMALLNCYYHTAKHLNGIKDILGTYAPVNSIDLDWYETIKELPKLGKKYLAQPMQGNTGQTLKEIKEEVEPERPMLDMAPRRELPKQQSRPEAVQVVEDVQVTKGNGLGLVPLNHNPGYQQPQSVVQNNNEHGNYQPTLPPVNTGPVSINQILSQDKMNSRSMGNGLYMQNPNQGYQNNGFGYQQPQQGYDPRYMQNNQGYQNNGFNTNQGYQGFIPNNQSPLNMPRNGSNLLR